MRAAFVPSTILVYVGLDLVGDGVMKLPFVRALRAAYPQARITWLAGKGRSVFAGALAQLVSGLIDEVIEDADIGEHWTELFGNPMPGRSFDLVIDTQRRALTTLILKRIRHRRFVSGAAGWMFSGAKPASTNKPPAMIGQMLQLLEAAAGRPVRDEAQVALDKDSEAEAARLLPSGPIYIGLAPGAGDRRKCWPLESFVALGKRIVTSGRVPVVLLGPAEREWEETFRAGVPQAILPLGEGAGFALTIALGRRLTAAVANDSGAGHLLAASGVPLVSLFGPTSPDKFAPSARKLTIIRAQDFGGGPEMSAIPIEVVASALK